MKDSVNLTDEQKELLRAIVSGHESCNGQEFIFVDADVEPQLTYPGGRWVPVKCSRTDFVRLEHARYITLLQSAPDLIRGQPTQLGIETVGRDFAPATPWLIDALLGGAQRRAKQKVCPTLGGWFHSCP